MSTFSMLRDGFRAGVFALASVSVVGPAAATDIYSWRTDDGAYAYTDDAKSIPARYREQAGVRATDGLANYHRITTPESGANDAYARRLSNRLDYLRSLNDELDRRSARPEARSGVSEIEVNAGDVNVGIPTDLSDEGPVVIETVRFRYRDEMSTRHNTVVRKGGRILTVIKGRPLVGPINQAPDVSEMVDD